MQYFDGNMIEFRPHTNTSTANIQCVIKHAVFQLISYKYVSQQKTVHLKC